LSNANRWVKKNRTQLSLVLGLVFLALARPTPGALFLGLLLIVPGESLRIWSSGHIHKNQVLTVTGPYSLTRNPLYLGSFILGTGFIICMGDIWLAVLFLLFFVVVYWITIRWEENKLSRKFPKEWEEYKGKVPRFFPMSRIPRYNKGEFSWTQVHKHKELANASIVLAVYVILWVKAIF
jgi:protein-S-isoprenylcysteine O-methyltransferase Ste14